MANFAFSCQQVMMPTSPCEFNMMFIAAGRARELPRRTPHYRGCEQPFLPFNLFSLALLHMFPRALNPVVCTTASKFYPFSLIGLGNNEFHPRNSLSHTYLLNGLIAPYNFQRHLLSRHTYSLLENSSPLMLDTRCARST